MQGGTWEQFPHAPHPPTHLVGVGPPGGIERGWGVEAKTQLPVQGQAEERAWTTKPSISVGSCELQPAGAAIYANYHA